MAEGSIVAGLYKHAQERPEKLAVIAGGQSAGYGRMAELVRGYAAFLREKGLRKGDVVLVRASQSLAHAVTYLAVHAGGYRLRGGEKHACSRPDSHWVGCWGEAGGLRSGAGGPDLR